VWHLLHQFANQKINDSHQPAGASQFSRKPTVKFEGQQWRKAYTGNAAEAGLRKSI
jgi:hypothetical protein